MRGLLCIFLCCWRGAEFTHPVALTLSVALRVLRVALPVATPVVRVAGEPGFLCTGLVVAVVGVGRTPITLPELFPLALAGLVRAIALIRYLRPDAKELAAGCATTPC